MVGGGLSFQRIPFTGPKGSSHPVGVYLVIVHKFQAFLQKKRLDGVQQSSIFNNRSSVCEPRDWPGGTGMALDRVVLNIVGISDI
jgi:hypothetical protein